MIFFDRYSLLGTDRGQSLIDESIGDAAIRREPTRQHAIAAIQSSVDSAKENPRRNS
jgi:hypothetical protein